MKQRPLIIDCDPGVDDALALLIAMAFPESFNILGISTVGGNVSLERVTKNALKICELAGRQDIPVYAGCGRPLVKPSIRTEEGIHGETGLGGSHLPEPILKAQTQHGVDFIIDTIHKTSEPVTLVPIGPLTNIAMALVKDPRIKENIAEIVFMGGSIFGGNVPGGYAEFNIFTDPHAADVVFRSGIKITMVGLDVTHKVPLTLEGLKTVGAYQTSISQFIVDMLEPQISTEKERFGIDGMIIHDACTIAYLLKREIFKGKDYPAFVEIHSPFTMGATLVDWHNWTNQPTNLHALYDVNADAFFEVFHEMLKRYKAQGK